MHKKILVLLFFLVFTGASLQAQAPTFTNSVGIEFALIQPGSMVVGTFEPAVSRLKNKPANRRTLPESAYVKADEMARQAAQPGFTVTLDKPYYIGKFEVTQAQWEQVMGNNPSFFKGDKVAADASKHPVENITWQDTQKFIQKLNKLDPTHRYRLPTEFEWEYAARAGAEGDIPWPDARAMAVLGGSTTSAIGQKQPNAWGLHDMLGNVWEWVQDYYNEKIFADPVPPRSGKEHVLKGASFTGDSKNATYMTHAAGPGNGYDIGFRLVMEVK
ncbi:MAG: formylglycine-generating enzyme family protein [Adhaeribacter sp.]